VTSDRWPQIEALCHAALARPVADRASFLANACGADEELRREVESLVAQAASGGSFLETPAAGAPAELAGRQLGVYRLEQLIGAGGMGEVYRARDTRLLREVAVKVLPAAWSADTQRRGRFEREARAVAALRHPNICTIHDVGHDEGHEFLVLELVDGESLAARLARGPLPRDEAIARAIEIADALDCAHRQGIVHRDLKPGNVMLARIGASSARQAKLLDFGLARLVSSDTTAARTAPTETTPMTASGVMLGTLQYMAPEQIEGRPADARSDIFAFGALLYEMLSGRRAFTADSSPRLMAAILRDDAPSLATLSPPLQPSLDRLVRTCLAKDPDDRFASIHDVLLELRWIASLEPEPVPAAATGPRRSPRAHVAWAGAAIMAALVGAYGGARFVRSSTDPPLTRLSLPLGDVAFPTQDLGLAISPDGETVVFLGTIAGEYRLFSRSIGERSIRALPNTWVSRSARFPFFSPDGRWLAYFADGKLLKRSMADGSVQAIAEVADGGGAASWGRDGYILFGRHGEETKEGVRRVSSDGGPLEVLSRPDIESGEMVNSMPQRLPGGDAIIYTSVFRRLSGMTWNVMVLPGGGTPPKVLIDGASRAVALDDGTLLYQVDTTLFATSLDSKSLALGERKVIAEGVNPVMLGGGWAATRDVLMYRPNEGGERRLVWVSRDGNREPTTAPARQYSNLRLSPQGDRVALRVDSKNSEVASWVYHLKQGVLSKVTPNTISGILWSIDGMSLTVEGGEGRAIDLYRVAADGSGDPQLLFQNGQPKYAASLTADGRTLVFTQLGDPVTRSDLWALDLVGERPPRPLVRTPAIESGGRLSPDGKWLAYTSDATGRTELYVTPFPSAGARSQVSTGGAREAVWSRDGRELFYRAGRQMMAVTILPGTTFAWEPPRRLFEGDYHSFGGPGSQSYDVSPDGRRFLMMESIEPAPRIDVVQGWSRLMARRDH
jgi:serine/threonine protein kinase